MPIEKTFDIPLIAAMALREKQIQQNYRPIIGVHKWFARRPGTLFRGLVLSEFSDEPLAKTYFRANNFPGRLIADPFVGGGTPLIEANRRQRCKVSRGSRTDEVGIASVSTTLTDIL